MDIGLALSFAFKDRRWPAKLGLAALLLMLPVVGLVIVLGWAMEISKRVVRGDAEPLPDWNDFRSLVMVGLRGSAVYLIYGSPMFIVALFPLAVQVIILLVVGDEDAATLYGGLAGLLWMCFAIPYGFLYLIVSQPALVNTALTGRVSAGLDLRQVFGLLRAKPGAYILAFVVWYAVGMLSGVGVFVLCVGFFFTYAYTMAVTGHLVGQAHGQAMAALAGAGSGLQAISASPSP